MGKLTNLQRRVLAELPDWIGVGLPTQAVALLLNAEPIAVSRTMGQLHRRGFVERDKPNEEWPYIYASTGEGRASLQQEQNPS